MGKLDIYDTEKKMKWYENRVRNHKLISESNKKDIFEFFLHILIKRSRI